MKSAIKNAKAKQYMSNKAFNELELSLNQALTHAYNERGDYKASEKNSIVYCPLSSTKKRISNK